MEQGKGPILYFIEGEAPTNEEFAKAAKFMNQGPMFEFISLVHYDFNSALREASGVGGKVPDVYKEYPVIDKAAPVKEVAEKKTLKSVD